MKYLLDTCVLSELVKKTPNKSLINWINAQQKQKLFISRISLAEIQKGILKIEKSQPEKYLALSQWHDHLERQFLQRILPISDEVLVSWAKISAHTELQGKKLAVMDSLIGATSVAFSCSLVTRNVSDFESIPDLRIINPFTV